MQAELANKRSKTEDLLKGYVSPMDRFQLWKYPFPYGVNRTAQLLRKLNYFEKVVLPELILPLIGIDEYHDRLLERVKAILFEVAHRLDSTGEYEVERKKYRKTFNKRNLHIHPNYWSRKNNYVEIWLGSKRSLMVQLLKAQCKGYFSPEASRFIAHRLSVIARGIGGER